MYEILINGELYHHGVKGQKWGVRKKYNKSDSSISSKSKKIIPNKLKPNKSDSAITKRVKNDYNNMDDKQFKSKYHTSKKTYAKRVNKYGDPYKNSPMAKIGKSNILKNASKILYAGLIGSSAYAIGSKYIRDNKQITMQEFNRQHMQINDIQMQEHLRNANSMI